jgi:hypothetical protein
MGRQEGEDSQDLVCSCGEKHTGHVCWLSRMGLLREVHHITCEPTVVCRQCGARANLPHNVCFPAPLAE